MNDDEQTMAGGGPMDAGGSSQQQESDPRLDFFSPSFDALHALFLPSLRAPRPRVRTLPSLEQCAVLLPPEIDIEDELHTPRTQIGQVAERRGDDDVREDADERAARRARAISRGNRVHRRALAASQEVESTFADIVARNLSNTSTSYSSSGAGPLNVIATAVHEKRRVRIVTRHRRGVRGSMIGLVLLFDDHLNMVLRDVDEEYTVRLIRGRKIERHRAKIGSEQQQLSDIDQYDIKNQKGTVEGNEDKSIKNDNETEDLIVRYRPKTERRQRHIHQVLLRGDSIVTVQLMD